MALPQWELEAVGGAEGVAGGAGDGWIGADVAEEIEAIKRCGPHSETLVTPSGDTGCHSCLVLVFGVWCLLLGVCWRS